MRANRALVTATVAVLLAVLLVGCSSSPSPNLQSPSPLTSSSTPPPTQSTTHPAPTPTWTPPAYGKAGPAVSAYLQLIDAYHAALRDPAKASEAKLMRFMSGQAQSVFLASLADERAHGRAFRGAAARSRVVVTSSALAATIPHVVLSDCPSYSDSDPWVEYVRATGLAVPTINSPKVPPPYEATIKVFQPVKGQWIVTSYRLDGSRTCTR